MTSDDLAEMIPCKFCRWAALEVAREAFPDASSDEMNKHAAYYWEQEYVEPCGDEHP